MSKLMGHLDVETRSALDLKATNAYCYFDHPTTDLWCVAYAIGSTEPKLWFPGQPCPAEIIEHTLNGGLWASWNCNFERLAWRQLLGPKYGWPVPKLEQYRCIMSFAYAMALPGKLEQAAAALGLSHLKDDHGYRLMLRMCKPRRPRKGEPPGVYWWDDPSDLARLAEYNLQDVRTEIATFERLLPLNETEQQVWFLDQRINDRGVYIDADLCNAANRIVAQTTKKLNQELTEITDYQVRGISNVSELIGFLRARGIETDSVAKDQIIDLLIRDDLPPAARRALEIRQEGSKTSTAKINAMLARRQAEGRMRGALQYHGAGTGRWAARGAQLQNLPRPALKKHAIPGAVEDLLSGDAELVEMIHGRPLTVVSDCIRSMIAAAPGNIIRAVDFSAIEARVVAWLAGEKAKLDVFRLYDAKQGPDPYRVAAAGIYGVPVGKVTESQRQVGKVASLALGYQGGPGAFSKMAKGYGLDIGAVFDTVWEATSDFNRSKAINGWETRGQQSGMMEKKWLAAELVKLAWRQNNPNIERLWWGIENAAIEAVLYPGKIVQAGAHVRYRRAGSFLFCRLPSGRAISYAYPRVEERETQWGSVKPTLLYKGVNGVTKKWEDGFFYGGLGVENITQAVARDVMRDAMLRCEAAGYKLVFTVHDELVSETAADFGSLEEFNGLASQNSTWATDLPIAVEGWEGLRYRK